MGFSHSRLAFPALAEWGVQFLSTVLIDGLSHQKRPISGMGKLRTLHCSVRAGKAEVYYRIIPSRPTLRLSWITGGNQVLLRFSVLLAKHRITVPVSIMLRGGHLYLRPY